MDSRYTVDPSKFPAGVAKGPAMQAFTVHSTIDIKPHVNEDTVDPAHFAASEKDGSQPSK